MSTPPLAKVPHRNATDLSSAPSRRQRSRLATQWPLTVELAGASAGEQLTTLDVSRTGLSFVAERPVTPGSKCQVTLQVPMPEGPVMLTAACKSVYSSYIGPRRFRIGLVFTQLDEAGQFLLRQLAG